MRVKTPLLISFSLLFLVAFGYVRPVSGQVPPEKPVVESFESNETVVSLDSVEVGEIGAGENPNPEPVNPKVPETDEEAQGMAKLLLLALQNNSWPVAVGFLLMLLVWAFNKFLKGKLSGNKWTPWIAVAVGVVGTVGANLALGALIWWEALIQGFLAGASATGFWELLFKHFMKVEVKEGENES